MELSATDNDKQLLTSESATGAVGAPLHRDTISQS